MTSQLGRITYGKDYNFYKSFTITSPTFGGDNPDGYAADGYYGANAMVWFVTQGVILTNETTGTTVEFSLNGTTTHGVINGDTTSTSRVLQFDNRVISKIWFRLTRGASANITMMAWSIR